MVWAAIWIGGRTELVIMKRDDEAAKNGYTARSYIQVLDSQLSDEWFEEMQFVQDNAPIHTANIVKDWFARHPISLVEWPPYSPDLNPIEQVWKMLKQQVLERYPHLAEAGKGAEVVEEFKEALRETWRLMDQSKIDNIIKSMTTRINAVREAEGWYTRFQKS